MMSLQHSRALLTRLSKTVSRDRKNITILIENSSAMERTDDELEESVHFEELVRIA